MPFGFSSGDDDDPRVPPSRDQGQAPGGFDLSPTRQHALPARPDDVPGRPRRVAARSTTTWPGSWPPPRSRRSHPASSVDVKAVAATRSSSPRCGWTGSPRSRPAYGPAPRGPRGSGSTRPCRPGRSCAARSPSGSRRPGSRACPSRRREQAGPLLAMMGSMGGMAFGSQLGQGLAQLAGEVLTSTDVGLPLGPAGTAALLPLSVSEFGSGLEPARGPGPAVPGRPGGRPSPAVRGCAVAPRPDPLADQGLRESHLGRLLGGRGARVVDRPERSGVSIESALGQGMFEPKITAGQQAALASLETLLALVEGWVDTVVAEAVGERLPGASALRETMRRRRAAGGPGGADLRHPDRARAAPAPAAGRRRSVAGDRRLARHRRARRALGATRDLLPTGSDLDDPAGFVDRDRQFNELLAGLGDFDTPPICCPTGRAAERDRPDAADTDLDPTDEADRRTRDRTAPKDLGRSLTSRRPPGPTGLRSTRPAGPVLDACRAAQAELDRLQRSMPDSTAWWSMVASSSSAKSSRSTAATLSSSWPTDDAPTSTDVTRCRAAPRPAPSGPGSDRDRPRRR